MVECCEALRRSMRIPVARIERQVKKVGGLEVEV